MLTLFSRLINGIGGERGQVLVIAVAVLALGLGAIMISVDVGWWLRDKRDAQNDADAIALAASQELGNQTTDRLAAELRGEDWAVANGINPSTEMAPPDCSDGVLQGNFCFIDRNADGTDDMVRVKVSRPSNSFIAAAFGVGSPTLNPSAAAAKVRAYGACVMPWAIDAVIEDPLAYDQVWGVLGVPPNAEQLFIFQLSPGGGFAGQDGSPGNFGALGVYGANDNDYTDTIENECGSKGEAACNSDSQVLAPGGTLACDIQTGNLGATTDKALRDRATSYGEVSPYTACDASSYADAVAKANSCLGRLVVLAIIKDFPQQGGGTPIDIYGIANFYIAGWDRCAPYNNGDCFDGVPTTGIVWGYLLLEELGGTPAWQFDFSQPSNNPFAPVIVALVE